MDNSPNELPGVGALNLWSVTEGDGTTNFPHILAAALHGTGTLADPLGA